MRRYTVIVLPLLAASIIIAERPAVSQLSPGILVNSVNYGSHLYGTTVDSFFTVRNTGRVSFALSANGLLPDSSMNWRSFSPHDYLDPVTHTIITYDPTVDHEVDVSGTANDFVRIPYRFIAILNGEDSVRLTIQNSTPLYPVITLSGTTVQPEIWGRGLPSPGADSIVLGGSMSQSVLIGNRGTAPLTVTSLLIGGGDAPSWTIGEIHKLGVGSASVVPFAIQPGDTFALSLIFQPTHLGISFGTLSIVSVDSLNRHAADSASGTTYAWTRFPYDTTVALEGKAYASGIDIHGDSLQTYVTRQATGKFTIYNRGTGPIRIDSIVSESPDAKGPSPFIGWAVLSQNTIDPDANVEVEWVFDPNPRAGLPISDGRRNYFADLKVYNSTPDTPVVHLGGRGYMVDMQTHIPRTYSTIPDHPIFPISIIVDKWNDSLGLADMRGFIMEMFHYRRTILSHRSQTVRPFLEEQYNADGTGSAGTSTEDAQCVVNIAETDLEDSFHNVGEQGYYEFVVQHSPQNAGKVGRLVNLMFHSLAIRDTSELDYSIKTPIDLGGGPMDYLNISEAPGLVTVGSVINEIGDEESAPHRLAILQNAPNPFTTSTAMSFTVPVSGMVTLRVRDVLGNAVETLVHEQLDAGMHTAQFRPRALPAGMYSCEMLTGTTRVVRRMMVVN